MVAAHCKGLSSCQVGNSVLAVLEEIAQPTDMKFDDHYLRIVAGMEVEGDTRPDSKGNFGSVVVDMIAGNESLASLEEEGMIGFAVLLDLMRESY